MNRFQNEKLRPFAQKLRREMTKEERRLWYHFLRPLPQTFKRQKVIGRYIVDFYCPEAKLVIELDGSQHYETSGISADLVRDAYLAGLGLRVLRYSNRDVNQNFSGVCEDVLQYLQAEHNSIV